MVEKLPDWNMPTISDWAQKGLDAIVSLESGINELDGWKRVVSFAGLAVGLHYLWDKVGGWIDDLKEKVGDFGQELAADVIDPIKEWIKETAMEKLKEIGGNAFKKVMETLATAWTGVKPWWDAAVKVAGGVKLVIDALGSSAARFMSRQKVVKDIFGESIDQGKIMRLTEGQLRRIIREALSAPSLDQWADENNLEVDIDPFTGEEVVLIDDDFAAMQGLPDGVDWSVERARDDSGWIVTTGGIEPEFEEFAAGDMGDLDDIGIQYRGY